MLTSYRLYHISAATLSLKKMGLKLNKMINPKTKKQWYPTQLDTEIMPSVKSLGKTQNEPGKRVMRRSAMLNKLFMKHITDLMSTGTVAMNILGRGIEISKVKIAPDLQRVNVFWVCKGDTTDKETEALLQSIAGPLRHELSTLRLMGEIPYIEFVKDEQEAQIVDIDRRLRLADYGEDYTPTDMGQILKSEFVLDMKLSPEMKAKIKQLEEDIPPIEEPIPEMTHNIYGLEHEKIMNRLLAARKKNREAWSNIDVEPVISYRVSQEKPTTIDVGTQKRELTDFLLKRKILQNKIHKELRKLNEDWQLQYDEENNDETGNDHRNDTFIDDYYDDEDEVYEHDFNKHPVK